MDAQKEIQRAIGRLNRAGTLAVPISCSDVIETLLQLDVQAATKIVDDLSKSAGKVSDPTNYILAAAKRLGATSKPVEWTGGKGAKGAAGKSPGRVFGKGMGEMVVAQPIGLFGGGYKGKGGSASFAAVPMTDPTGKIGKQVGWLNKNANLVEKVSYSDVVGPLSEIDGTAAMKILKDLEEAAPNVKNPTSYVVAAAKRLGAGSGFGGGYFAPVPVVASYGGFSGHGFNTPPRLAFTQPSVDQTGMIGKQIGRLNKTGGLNEKISYSDVVELLSALDVSAAMGILKDLENTAATVTNPTSYIAAAARRAMNGNGKRQYEASVGGGHGFTAVGHGFTAVGDDSKQISKQVGQLNRSGSLNDKISYSDVEGPLNSIDINVAMKILRDLQNKASEVKEPTKYILTACNNAMHERGPPAKRARTQVSQEPKGEASPDAKKISQRIGHLNKKNILTEKISYSDVKDALGAIGVDCAMSILNDLEAGAANVANPTSFIVEATSGFS